MADPVAAQVSMVLVAAKNMLAIHRHSMYSIVFRIMDALGFHHIETKKSSII